MNYLAWIGSLVSGIFAFTQLFKSNKRIKHKKKDKNQRKNIPDDIRDQVWLKHHGGKTVGTCYCCGDAIYKYHGGWHCSHVISVKHGGKDEVDNLRPCCRTCNLTMGTRNLYEYKKSLNIR